MDDPWGSPWAVTGGDKSPPKPPSPTKSDLERPPRAFLATDAPSIPTLTTQSPWADDDGFGDWASADPTPSSGTNEWGGGGWGGTDLSGSNKQLAPDSRADAFGHPSPIKWPANAATSPRIRSLSRSSSQLFFRQQSPDPWATEAHIIGKDKDRDIPAVRDPSPIRLDASPGPRAGDDAFATQLSEDDERLEPEQSSERNIPDDLGVKETKTAESPDVEPDDVELTIDTAQGDSEDDHVGVSEVEVNQTPVSRRASSSSTDSRPGNARQDSPITSIDEDSRIRPQLTQRKVSGKVQELVELFDGLAKVPVEESPAPRVANSSNEADSEQDDHGVDSDDGTEESCSLRPASPPLSRPTENAPGELVVPKVRVQSPATHIDQASDDGDEEPNVGVSSDGASIEQIKAKFGPLQFAPDTSLVNQIYDKLTKSLCEPTETIYVPDHPLIDSFTTISERKTWYRVSRQGSARKHNAGDDDNYRRVVWPTSTVHADTIKIVRRWMEEDSFTGKSNLGGSAHKGNLFGWDSAAEPVSLETVFARKRESMHARSGSRSQPLQAPPVADVSPTPAKPATGLQPTAPVVGFGWNTTPVTGGASAHVPPETIEAGLSSVKPHPIEPTFSLNSERLGADAGGTSQPSETHIATTSSPDDDDDDDWGDMISSPHQAQPPKDISSSFGLDALAKEPSTEAGAEPPKDDSKVIVAPPTLPASNVAKAMDPWAMADFSMFNAPVRSGDIGTVAPAPADIDIHHQKGTETLAATRSTAGPRQSWADDVELDAEQAVSTILSGLPDLSYMLR